MRKNLSLWQFAGFAITAFLGTLSHFLFDWTNSLILAPFTAVNESTWEHMKILFFPMFAFAIFESFFIKKDVSNFWCVKLKGILLGLIVIPVLFYTFNGVFGKTPDWINISIFYIAAAITYIYETRTFNKKDSSPLAQAASFIVLCIIALAFVLFTFATPEIPIFKDPTTNRYGLE